MNEHLAPFLAALNLILGGGLLGVWLKYRVQASKIAADSNHLRREEDRVDFQTILAEVKSQRDEAWGHIKIQDGRIDALEAEINGLRLARDLDPFPNWLVDLQGQYVFANREFEKHFLEPDGLTYRDIIGKTHDDVWPAPFCEILRVLDAKARGRPDGTARSVVHLNVPSIGNSRVTVHRFPIRFKGVIVAYAGFVTDIEADAEMIGMAGGAR